jgi:hypothetical protein
MTWTKKIPTAVGWYWMRCRAEKDNEPSVIHVRNYAGNLAIGNSHLRGWHSLKRYEWAGPIQLPSEPSDESIQKLKGAATVDADVDQEVKP